MEEKELTFKIRGCVYEVFRVLGSGLLEQVYQQALLQELQPRRDYALKANAHWKLPIRESWSGRTSLISEWMTEWYWN